MFSPDKQLQAQIDFIEKAKTIADKYGATLVIDWQNNVLDFKSETISERDYNGLIAEVCELADEMECAI